MLVFCLTATHLVLLSAAAERGMPAAEWLASLIAAKLGGRPRWGAEEIQHLQTLPQRCGRSAWWMG